MIVCSLNTITRCCFDFNFKVLKMIKQQFYVCQRSIETDEIEGNFECDSVNSLKKG